ncbi:MAG: hypothetical protein CMM02_03885 [Rhodopirellula sp.]|nr:hypothetical protein [Rhodopirellula sp.]|tara:strand:+ start:403 stop:747 length:345 start_codon:yes stop_codon:yes gene_type:complete
MRPERELKLKCDWNTFYWSDDFKSRNNETLQHCFNTYGVGGWMSRSRDMVAALIFLDETRSACNSWLLGVKHFRSNKQADVALYQNEDTVDIPSNSVLGEEICEALSASEFDVQ